MSEATGLKVEFETIAAPVAPPHEYLPIIDQLIAAGPDQAASVVFADEAAAKTYVLEMQKAARQRGMSGVKRVWEALEDAKGKATGQIKAGVSVRAKITRKAKPAETAAETAE